MTGGGGGGGLGGAPFRSHRSPRNVARTSEIAQRERPRYYFSQKLHILLVMIIYANHMHKLCFSLFYKLIKEASCLVFLMQEVS